MTTPYAARRRVVERVVLGEGAPPHRGPQVVGLEPQHHLEDLGVEGAVEAARVAGGEARAEGGGCPGAERGVLVVDEEPAVLHRGRALRVRARQHVQRVLPPRRHVVPVVPGRDADAPRDVVGAVDRAALVAARDHEGALHAGQRVLDDLLQRGLPPALDRRDVELPRGDEAVDQPAAADGADQDDGAPRGGAAVGPSVETFGRMPVTRARSSARSPATRTTPWWSSAATARGVARARRDEREAPGAVVGDDVRARVGRPSARLPPPGAAARSVGGPGLRGQAERGAQYGRQRGEAESGPDDRLRRPRPAGFRARSAACRLSMPTSLSIPSLTVRARGSCLGRSGDHRKLRYPSESCG